MLVNVTVKFISKVVHVGPDESTVSRVRTRSKAAGKLNMTLGASVKLKSSVRQDKPENSTKVVTHQESMKPEDAVLVGNQLMDAMSAAKNSDGYTEAKANFDTVKARVLSELGVRNYTDLTSDQRAIYAKRMIAEKAPFYYTERSIHIKVGECKTIYSTTRRVLGTAHWNADAYQKLVDLTKLRNKYEVTFKQISGSSLPSAGEPSEYIY